MDCNVCGEYANASVNGIHGGRVFVCDEHISAEPEATYTLGKYPHIGGEVLSTGRPVGRPRGKKVVTAPAVTIVGHSCLSAQCPVCNPYVSKTEPKDIIPNRIYASVETPLTVVTLAQSPVVLELPEPPSANRWWRRHGSVMHLSREAKQYKADVATRGQLAAPAFSEGPVSVVIVWRRDRKAGDLDKRLGVLLDALQGVVYANDSQVVQIWARRCDEHPTLQPGTVRVEISAI